jgi:hypothetical protein
MINKRKQIFCLDKPQQFVRPSFFDFPSLPSKSFLQTNFSKNIFSELKFVFIKPSVLESRSFSKAGRKRLQFFSWKRHRLQKRRRHSKKCLRFAHFLRVSALRRCFSKFMSYSSSDFQSAKSDAKQKLVKASKISRFSLSSLLPENVFSFKTYSYKGVSVRDISSSYLFLFKALKLRYSVRALFLKRARRRKVRLASLGFKSILVCKKHFQIAKKRKLPFFLRSIKFYNKKSRFSNNRVLKFKVKCFPKFKYTYFPKFKVSSSL